jgi:hypothetical protein
MKIFTITIKPCTSNSISKTTRVRSNDLTADSTFNCDWETNGFRSTVDRAVEKLYGRGCFFVQNHGLALGYGQIFKPYKGGGSGSASVTGSIRIEVQND